MEYPKISVIVPIYNVEKYLIKCVNSILQQTYRNLEIILVDDGSPDNCPALCDEFAEKDSRIIVIHKKNGGLSDARNVGLDWATGDYIGFVDSDDYISPDMYKVLLERLLQTGSDMAICNYLCVDEQYEMIPSKNSVLPIQNECLIAEDFLESYTKPFGWHYVVAYNKLYRISLFDQIRYPYGKQYEDEFVIHHIVSRCRSIACVKEGLYFYVQRPGSIMHQHRSIKEMDFGEALIDQYHFAKSNGPTALKNFSARRLSNKMAEWKSLSEGNEAYQKRYEELRKRSLFLLFEKSAWEDYGFKAKTYYRLELMIPGLGKNLRRILHRDS